MMNDTLTHLLTPDCLVSLTWHRIASKKWNVISLKSVMGLMAKAMQLTLLLNWFTRPLTRTYDPLLDDHPLSYQPFIHITDWDIVFFTLYHLVIQHHQGWNLRASVVLPS